MPERERRTMLVVDDVEMNRAVLAELFSSQFNIKQAQDGEEALALIRGRDEPFAVILLDLVMPKMDGFAVLREMAVMGELERTPVVVITAQTESQSERAALALGAKDIIHKPFESEIVVCRVRNVVDSTINRRRLEQIADDLIRRLQLSKESMVRTLASIMEHRSLESGQHILRIRAFTEVLLREVAHSFSDYDLSPEIIGTISSASMLHDIGKVVIPDAILNKPGRLTAEEFEIMKTHAAEGGRIVRQFDSFQRQDYMDFAYQISRHHHERWDGSGYPDGLKGDLIPIAAQVAGVADVYDALTNDRVYKPAFSHQTAVEMIMDGQCGLFGPDLMECFSRVSGEFERLAAFYRDSAPLSIDDDACEQSETDAHIEANETRGYDRQRYHTALRLLTGSVLELDLNTGTYHLSYPTLSALRSVPSSGTILKHYPIFLEKCVHPEDRERMDEHVHHFFDKLRLGLVVSTELNARLYISDQCSYQWHRIRMHRIDTHHPQQYRVLILWQNVGTQVALQAEYQQLLYKDRLREDADVVLPGDGLRRHLFDMHRYYQDFMLELDLQTGLLYYDTDLYTHYAVEPVHTLDDLRAFCQRTVYPADQTRFLHQVQEMAEGARGSEIRYRIRNLESNYEWVSRKTYTIYNNDGKARGVIGILRRLTDVELPTA